MTQIKDFLLREVRKPVDSFFKMMRWTAKASLLLILRLILWGFFFVIPSLLLALLSFHWFTKSLRGRLEQVDAPQAMTEQTPVQPHSMPSQTSAFRILNQDLRFWLRELERFRK